MATIKTVAISIVVLLLLMSLCFFTVNEGESALVLRLGKIVDNSHGKKAEVLQPGLHVKLPFIDHVRYFDTRMQQLITPSSQPLVAVTKEQTYLVVEYFAKWRIND